MNHQTLKRHKERDDTMFEKHIEAYYRFLAKKPLTSTFSIVKSKRKSISLYEFDDTSWVLIPNDIDTIKNKANIAGYTKKEPQRLRFINQTDFKEIKNKELCRSLTSEDAMLFQEFLNGCSKEDKEEGMVSLEDHVVYGCIVDNKITSVCSLLNFGDKLSDVGILTHPEYRYNGYAKSVCQTLMSEHDKLYLWRCDATNKGSNRLAESIGFIIAGESNTLSKT